MNPKDGVYIAPAYEAVRENSDNTIECGRGPEAADARKEDNPNWLRNRAANYIALAEWIEGAGRRKAEEAHRLNKRRDELVREIYEAAFGPEIPVPEYQNAYEVVRVSIDRIIELESTP